MKTILIQWRDTLYIITIIIIEIAQYINLIIPCRKFNILVFLLSKFI